VQIFRRKPFMLCCFCFIATAVLSFFVIGTAKLISLYVILGFSVAVAVFIICLKKHDARIKLSVLLIALVLSAISIGESYFYYNVYADSLAGRFGKNVKAEVTVIDERISETYYSEYLVSIDSVDNEKIKGKAILHIEGESGVSIGKTVEIYAECVSLEKYLFNKSVVFSYISDGIIGAFEVNADNASDVIFKESASQRGIADINSKLTYKLERLVEGEPGKLSAAILLGRRDRLSEETERDFSRSGISHMLALSGLHVAVLAGFFDFILKRLGVSKLCRCILLPTVMLGYLALTGFSLSTVRAAVMLTAVYLSYIIASPIDKLTVLFASCAAIIALLPSSVADIGFWMSYLAAFGLMLVSPYISRIFNKRKNLKHSGYPKAMIKWLLKNICQSLLITLTAVLSVLLLTQIAFGELSLVSLGTNLFVGPLMTAFLILSVLLLFFGALPIAEKIFSYALMHIGNLILDIASYFSNIKNACISLEYGFAKIIIWVFTAVMAVLLVIKIKKKAFMLLPFIACSLAFAVCFSVMLIKNRDEAELIYLKRGERETFVVMHGVDAALIDIGDGNYSNYTVAWEEARLGGATEIEKLVLTHYHRKHGYSIERLLSNVKVRCVLVPYPENREDALNLSRIYEITEKHGAECRLYERETPVEIIDEIGLELLPSELLKRSVQPTIAFGIKYGDFKVAYIGSSYYESKYTENADACALSSDILIYGTHGPNPKADYPVDSAKNAREIVFADDELVELAYTSEGQLKPEIIVYDCEIRKFKIQKTYE